MNKRTEALQQWAVILLVFVYFLFPMFVFSAFDVGVEVDAIEAYLTGIVWFLGFLAVMRWFLDGEPKQENKDDEIQRLKNDYQATHLNLENTLQEINIQSTRHKRGTTEQPNLITDLEKIEKLSGGHDNIDNQKHE